LWKYSAIVSDLSTFQITYQ